MPTITDWLMVAITAVYVIATIFICRANIKSAAATREQVAEAKRQYEEEHRPYIAYEFIYEQRTWYGMRFTNHGRRVASHVNILLNQEFLDSVPRMGITKGLADLATKEFTLGIGQSYDIFFGADEFRNNPKKKPICGEIVYQDHENSYQEHFEIDFEKYATIFTVDTPADVLHEDMKKMVAELSHIKKELRALQSHYEVNFSPSKTENTNKSETTT